jgi:hypothetical protein
MKIYLTTTFSPSMLPEWGSVEVSEIPLARFQFEVRRAGDNLVPAVGHENTAGILEKQLEGVVYRLPRLFNRINIVLEPGDMVLAAIPQFRADAAREFSDREIFEAEFRYFVIR